MRRAWLLGLAVLTGCTGSRSSTTSQLPSAVRDVVASGQRMAWMTNGTDPWQVFVCHVPADSKSPVYAGLPLRLPLQPADVSTVLNTNVTKYFATLSNGAYKPTFSVGGEVAITASDGPQSCVDRALAAAGAEAHGVIVVADAEHNAAEPGGLGSPGDTCSAPPCGASTNRRSAYVGTADFSPDWGDRPPMDLIEHEMGHALGWPHSGYDESATEPHRSALDVMSDSAAPRAVHPQRRDAPDTLAINRLQAGWLPASAVAVVPPAGGTFTLAASNGPSGTRLAVIGVDDHSFITVELLTAAGLDDHLPASGLAVHLVEGTDATRTQTPLVGQAPYADLLTPGATLATHGWSITVDDGWRATIHPLAGGPTVSG